MPFVPFGFAILADSGVSEGGSLESPRAAVKFKVAWGDRIAFVNFVCGTVVGGAGSIVRTPPMRYPPSPNMRATRDFEIQPLGKLSVDATGWVAYPFAVVTINFAIPEYSIEDGSGDPSGQPWTTTTFDVSGEFLTLPDSAYKFSGGVPTGSPVGKIIPQVAISMKRHWVPYLPVSAMLGLIGKVNNATFTIGDFTCQPETLLFLGGPNQRQADTAGGQSQEVEYKFSYRPVSWNKFIHPNGTSGFQYITDGSGNKVYDAGSFGTLP